MSLGTIFALIGPLVTKFLSGVIDRFWNSGVSTVKGTATGAMVIGAMELLGCDMSLANELVIGGVAGLPYILDKDADSKSQAILASMKARIEQAKRSKQVEAEAIAAQERAAKDAGI